MRRIAPPGGYARPTNAAAAPSPSVDLYWLPLGAGDASRLVRWSGSAYEAIVARSRAVSDATSTTPPWRFTLTEPAPSSR